MDLSVSSSSWCLGRAAVCDCCTPWTFLLPFFIYSTDRSKAVVPVLVLLCCFLVYSTRRLVLSLALCYFVLVFFSPFSILQKGTFEAYDCNNYRCLSLTSCLGKLFTSLLQCRLNTYMVNNNLYYEF